MHREKSCNSGFAEGHQLMSLYFFYGIICIELLTLKKNRIYNKLQIRF